jgi:hypothetical protein
MPGFKTFRNAEVTLSGIELANKIKKGQFDTSEITGPGAMVLHVWEAVLVAELEVENRLSLPSPEKLYQNLFDRDFRHMAVVRGICHNCDLCIRNYPVRGLIITSCAP